MTNCPIHNDKKCYCDPRPDFFKKERKILPVRAIDRRLLDEYIGIYVRTTVLPKKVSAEGYGEYYRRVILNRLQNMTYKSIAEEHGISLERVRQICWRFKNWCKRRKNHELNF